MRDLANQLGLVVALSPAVQSATQTSSAIDLQGFNSAMAVVSTGAIVGSGDFNIKLQESDTTTSGDFTDVAAANLLTPTAIPATLVADSAYKIGYKGSKRYIRTVLTKAGGTSLAAGILVVRGSPASAPVA